LRPGDGHVEHRSQKKPRGLGPKQETLPTYGPADPFTLARKLRAVWAAGEVPDGNMVDLFAPLAT
jgi:hypothetical protein